jgi:hypothetical protein
MELDCGLSFSEACPGKQRQAQIDGGGIERIDGLLQFHAEAVLGIEPTRRQVSMSRRLSR